MAYGVTEPQGHFLSGQGGRDWLGGRPQWAQQIQPQTTQRCEWNHKEWSTVTHHLAVAILKHCIHIYLKIKHQWQVIKCIQKPNSIQEYFFLVYRYRGHLSCLCHSFSAPPFALLCLLLWQPGVLLWILTH